MILRMAAGIALLSAASIVSAQGPWVPGSEITGQQVQVETFGVINYVTFEPNGIARISSPSGAKVVDATWTAGNGELCLFSGDKSDCYPYARPFQAGQAVDLTSKCAVPTRWLAPAVTRPAGERG